MFGLEYTLLTCATCSRDCNADDETMTRLDDDYQCEECRESCPCCGEWITDETIKMYGKVVHWRDYVLDGKLVTMHCDCAASTFLTYLNPNFDDDYTTRGEIAAAVEPHYAEALVQAKYRDAVCIGRNGWFYIFKRMAVTPHFTASNIVDFGRSEREAWINAGKEVRNAA
jgi:hypothetical protein